MATISLLLALAATADGQNATDRTIAGALPVWSAQITASLATQIAKQSRVPLGIEAFPRNPAARLLQLNERRDLRGATVREALDWLVQIDPRYRWSEMRGMIVIRPAAAWDDPDHHLHRGLGDVTIESRAPLDLLLAIKAFFSTGTFESTRAALSGKELNFAVPNASVLDVLNEAARVGNLVWEVDYGMRKPGQSSLWLHSANGDHSVTVDLPFPLPSWLDAVRRGPLPARESPADRIIDGVLTHTRRHLDAAVALSIAKLAKVPLGFELIPSDPYAPDTALPIEGQKVLTGLTVREALDWLVELDMRYYWVESRGTIVIRPVAAWGDAKHFLNTLVEPFSVEERDALEVLGAISQLLERGNLAWPFSPNPVWLPATLSFRTPTGVLEVLNELASASSLVWMIHYERDPAMPGQTVRIEISDVERTRQGGGSVWLRQPIPRWLR